MKPVAEVAELDLRQVSAGRWARRWQAAPRPWCFGRMTGSSAAPPSPPAARKPPTPTSPTSARSRRRSRDAAVSKRTHDAKALERAVTAAGGELAGVTFDTLLGGVPARPGHDRLRRCSAAQRALPRHRPARRDRRGRRRAAVRRGPVASHRRRGRGRRPARAGDGGADRQAGPALAARRRRAAAVVGARADGGARHPARRRLPRRDGRGGPRPDGDAARPRSTSSPDGSST